jgi:hypothetical protein
MCVGRKTTRNIYRSGNDRNPSHFDLQESIGMRELCYPSQPGFGQGGQALARGEKLRMEPQRPGNCTITKNSGNTRELRV